MPDYLPIDKQLKLGEQPKPEVTAQLAINMNVPTFRHLQTGMSNHAAAIEMNMHHIQELHTRPQTPVVQRMLKMGHAALNHSLLAYEADLAFYKEFVKNMTELEKLNAQTPQ